MKPAALPPALALALALHASAARAQSPRLPFPLPGRMGGAARAEPTPAERAFTDGEARLRRGDVDGARGRFEEARRLDPRDPRPVYYLGEVARAASRWAEAEALFRDAARLRPTMAEAHAQLGAVLREAQRMPEAVASLEQAVRLAPSLGEARYNLGLCYEDQGDRARAVAEYRRASQQLASDPMPALALGLALAGDDAATAAQRAEAMRALREAVRRGADRREVLLSAGPALRRLGEAGAAVTALERARTLGEPNASLLGELAQALWVTGDRAAAEQRMREALERSPREATLRYVHGLMLADAGQRDAAAAEFRQAASLAGDTPLAERARQRLRALEAAPRPGARPPR